jgi:hypothetical protein
MTKNSLCPIPERNEPPAQPEMPQALQAKTPNKTAEVQLIGPIFKSVKN